MNWPFPTVMTEKVMDTINTIKDEWVFPKSKSFIQEIAEATEPVTLTATKERIKFIHFNEDDVVCTVAYRPCNFTKGLKMLEVAVSYKHPKDQYNKKIGARNAAQRFLEGRTVCVPLRGKTNDETYWNLYHAFVVAADQQ
jgi:hypothetical protein